MKLGKHCYFSFLILKLWANFDNLDGCLRCCCDWKCDGWMIGALDKVPPLGGNGKTLELSECTDGGPADEEDEDTRPDLSTMYGRAPDGVGIADDVASL